jgi:hypothetical protein
VGTEVFDALAEAATTTALVSDGSPSTAGNPVTFTATVTSTGGTPTGQVEFFDGIQSLGVEALVEDPSGGVAMLTTSALTVGEHTIRAEYLGDGGFLPSSSNDVVQDVQ